MFGIFTTAVNYNNKVINIYFNEEETGKIVIKIGLFI